MAVEVFAGNTADPSTVGLQIEKLRERFSLSRIVVVGDRGLLTNARIREELEPASLAWITARRAPQISELVEQGDVELSLFDERTWPRSPPRNCIPANDSSCAAIRCWRQDGRESASPCWWPPKRSSKRSCAQRRAPTARCGAPPTSP